ncbi:MAG: hypothetical protein M1816_003314 [Peltula sp. TS41687]|nr:MAG: hypothetical protein M1816_003314 [Peltula sp. TS41687]
MSASHVVVLDSTARRAVIKVNPNTHLSDVLHDACSKLNVNANHHGLRNNNRQVDLSRTIRLSGLSSGAKLELVLLSKSPSAVSVALQLPESEVLLHNKTSSPSSPNQSRLVDKFPSTTTLWLVLRKFESGGESGGPKYNFTARGVPQMAEGATGSGRLVYETPVVQVIGRELSAFTELQKSLAQLGFNSGSVLLRLSFRQTQTPLEEAMLEIEQYFRSIDTPESSSSGAHAGSVGQLASVPDVGNPDALKDGATTKSPPVSPLEEKEDGGPAQSDSGEGEKSAPAAIPESGGGGAEKTLPGSQLVEEEEAVDDATIVGPGQRPMTIYAAPTDTTPQASRHTFHESDYELTIDQAKLHQSRLSHSSRNRRLPSEAELRSQEAASTNKLSRVTEVEIKIRYPDQTQVVSKFSASDTVGTLYGFVRAMLHHSDQPFLLSYSSAKGPAKIIPREEEEEEEEEGAGATRLIADLGFSGRMLVNFVWDEKASDEARLMGEEGSVLRSEFVAAAKQIRVEEVRAPEGGAGGNETAQLGGNLKETFKGIVPGREEGREKKALPKWLKLPGKK